MEATKRERERERERKAGSAFVDPQDAWSRAKDYPWHRSFGDFITEMSELSGTASLLAIAIEILLIPCNLGLVDSPL